MDEEDKILIKAYLEGDNMATEKIIRKYLPVIYNYVFRLVSSEEADDITQDVFIKVWRNLRRFNGDKASFKTWLFSITRNTTIDYFKKKKSTPFSFLKSEEKDFSEVIIDESFSIEEEISKKEDIALLNKALEKIDQKYKEILILYYQEDMTFKEIGQLLNKPLNTVKNYHYRAILKLRDILKDMHQD